MLTLKEFLILVQSMSYYAPLKLPQDYGRAAEYYRAAANAGVIRLGTGRPADIPLVRRPAP